MGTRRLRALMVRCPKCGSPPNVACSGKRGPRRAPHIQRMTGSPGPAVLQKAAVALPPVPADALAFYASDEWRTVRYQALRRSRGCCECCGAGPTPGKPLHVDHIKPRSRFPRMQLDLDNLQVLCADCNLGKSNTDTIDWRKPEASA